jgi:hypothetical protein
MELDETTLRERLDTAVSGLTPDTVALVGGGHDSGLALRRRRRWQATGSARAGVALVGAAVYVSGDIFDQRATGPADSVQLVPATPRGMAAAVIASADLGTPIAAAGAAQTATDPLQVGLGYDVDGQKVEVAAITSTDLSQWGKSSTCPEAATPQKEAVSCDDAPLADGTPALRVVMRYVDSQGAGSTKTGYLAVVAIRRADQLLAVTEQLRVTGDDPGYTADSLPIPIDTLMKVATDPLVGLSTTADLNEAGTKIADFKDSLLQSSSSAGSESTVGVEEAPSYPAPTVEKSTAEPAH